MNETKLRTKRMNVLLLDTGFSALPIYEYLVAARYDVWVMGNRPQDVVARKAGHQWICQDYSNVLEVGRYVERLKIDKIVPGCTDISIRTCAALTGSDGHIDTEIVNDTLADKYAFRGLCAELDLPSPRCLTPDQLPLLGRFICKPVDAYSGRGITVFDGLDHDAAREALETAESLSPSGRALIEPFVEGQLYSWSAFIEKGRPVDAFFVCEGSSANPFAVDTSYVDYDMPDACQISLRGAVEKIANKLGLVDGLVHTQFLWNGSEVSIVEMARRCPGDLYALLIEYSTGYPYAAKYASYFVGEHINANETCHNLIIRHTVTSLDERIYSGLHFDPSVTLKAFYPLQHSGHVLPAGNGGRVGVLFCAANNRIDRDLAYQRLLSRSAYHIS